MGSGDPNVKGSIREGICCGAVATWKDGFMHTVDGVTIVRDNIIRDRHGQDGDGGATGRNQ